jgi:hypothetical protein
VRVKNRKGAEAFLALDRTGQILWANAAAHRLAGVVPGALIGRNYLEFCPPQTHADLLRLHARKLKGETVKFLLPLEGRTVEVTSGPVKIGRRTYLFVVARRRAGGAGADAAVVGRAVVAQALGGREGPLDLSQALLAALREEARLLRGKVRLRFPDEVPAVRGRADAVRMILRCLLLAFARRAGGVCVRLGKGKGNVWVEFSGPPGGRRVECRELSACRPLLASREARVRRLPGGGIRLSLPSA